MNEEEFEQTLFKLQGRVSKTIYDRVQALKDVSGQTTNSLVHQMVVHSLPHFESLYFGAAERHHQSAKVAIESLLKDPSVLGMMFGAFQSKEDESTSKDS
jgi:hypothetical protein